MSAQFGRHRGKWLRPADVDDGLVMTMNVADESHVVEPYLSGPALLALTNLDSIGIRGRAQCSCSA